MRKQIAAANWKMNLTLEQGSELVKDILDASLQLKENQLTILAVPFPYLLKTKRELEGRNGYAVAAQNCYHKKSGAYTGEVSVEMLQSMNIPYCIIGHSERREYFNETNEMLADKVDLCLEYGITPIFCCGEPLPIREVEKQDEYVGIQLKESLFHLPAEKIKTLIIAYEPIWAIGTGKTATIEQAQEMHRYIVSVLANQYGSSVAEEVSVLYGGSVKANNAKALFGCAEVDGGLVGGASLVAADFIEIIKALK